MSASESQRARTPGVLQVAVVTPEGSAYDAPAESVVVPAYDGEVAIFRGHAPFVAQLGAGELRVRAPGGESYRLYLEGGVVQVLENVVTVLAEHVVPAADIDRELAEKDLADALAQVPSTDEAFALRDQQVVSARARLQVVDRG